MIFEALDKMKRNSIFTTILLITLGIIILLIPDDYISVILLTAGFALCILGLVMVMDFFASYKSLVDYIKFVGAVLLGIFGICVLIFKNDSLIVLALVFGILMIVDGLHTLLNSVTFARRSKRKGWWVLTILSVIIMGIGVVLCINPWFADPKLFLKVIGGSILFAAGVSAIRLIWTWPVKKEKENKEEEVAQDEE